MLYIIGLGLDENGISKQGLDAVNKCQRIYLESYTIEFSYSKEKLEKTIGKKIISAGREFVESLKIVEEAKKLDIALLVYGSPLIATTHTSLIQEARKLKVNSIIIHGASILDAVSNTGLHPYKFGKITSLPKWEKNFTPSSFIETIKENQKIKAHSLILVDIGMDSKDAIAQLTDAGNKKIDFEKIVVGSKLGTKQEKIFYEKPETLMNKKIKNPFCIIIPGNLHFTEKEFLESSIDKII